MTARHIALVSPGHLSTNPRLVKEARSLCEAGYRVTTISGDFLQWARDADREFDEAPWQKVKVPFGRETGRARWLAQSAVRELGRRAGGLFPRARWADFGFHSAVWPLARAARAVRADMYIAHNLAALPAAGAAARWHRAQLGFDAEDDHVEELADTPPNVAERARRESVLRAWLPRATHRTVSAPLLGDDMQARYGCAFDVVRNVFDPGPDTPTTRNTPPRFYWFSQTIGPDRGLQQIVTILARMRVAPALTVRGNATEWTAEWLDAELGGVPVNAVPPVSPSRMVSLCGEHDVGLAIEIGDTRNRDRCLSNKAFTYVAAGMPVVLSDTTAQRALASELGDAAVLIDLDDAEHSAQALDAFCTDARWNAAIAAAAAVREKLNWRNEQQIFLRSVDRALRRAERAG